MINNFELIKPLLHRENDNEFYYLQIIARKKDIVGMTWNNRGIKDYYIFSMDQLEKKLPEIISLCNQFEARAYIRLSRRDCRTIATSMIIDLWEAFKNNSFKHLRNIYSTAVGRDNGLDKIRIIDIDSWEGSEIWIDFTDCLYNVEPIGDKIIWYIPTKNWIHIITKPFNLWKRKDMPFNASIDVHKNNPTILYIP